MLLHSSFLVHKDELTPLSVYAADVSSLPNMSEVGQHSQCPDHQDVMQLHSLCWSLAFPIKVSYSSLHLEQKVVVEWCWFLQRETWPVNKIRFA